MKLHVFLNVVAECESNVTQSTMECNFAGITLQVVPGDYYLTTQITVLWILHSMNLYVSPYVVHAHGNEFLDTQSTDIWIVPSMTLHVSLFIVPGDESFTTQSTLI